jgi:hypothetical protein
LSLFVLPDVSPALAVVASDLSLVLPAGLAGSVVVSVAAVAEESVLSLAWLCEEGSLEEVSRVLRSDDDEEEDDAELEEESLRRGAGSWLEDGALLLMAWVLLSTSESKESLGDVFEPCGRAGFCGALDTCALAATSDVTPTTGNPSKTSSDQEGARSGPARDVNIL